MRDGDALKSMLGLMRENVARTCFGGLQSAVTRTGLDDSERAAMRHVTTKCTGDRHGAFADGWSWGRSR